jgi:hypothetical protein
MSACNLFDEMASSDFDEWRSPNRVRDVVIHRVCYLITELVLHQVFGSFGGVVEQILVIGGKDVVMASVVFDSVEAAADAYGELHGRNIYDACCQMHIKWGLPTPATQGAHERVSRVTLTAAPSAAASVAPVAAPVPAASTSVALAPSTSPTSTTTTSPTSASAAAAAASTPFNSDSEQQYEVPPIAAVTASSVVTMSAPESPFYITSCDVSGLHRAR